MARASRARRSLNWAWEIFSATIRSNRVSRALKTWPIPPSPIGAITSYGPNLRAGSSDIHGHCTRETRSGAATPQNSLRGEIFRGYFQTHGAGHGNHII